MIVLPAPAPTSCSCGCGVLRVVPFQFVSPPGIRLQQRDHAFLRDLFESRLMTVMHAAALHFDGKSEAAKKRIYKLKFAGFIAERQRRVYEPSVLHLTASGVQVLDDAGILAGYPTLPRRFLRQRVQVSEQTLRHELEVMDVKSAFTATLRCSANLVLDTFTTWPLPHEFSANRPDGKRVTVKPDGFIHFHRDKADNSQYLSFLELDRGTESQDILAHRAACYREHYRSGDFAARHGGLHSRPQDHPFRVLFVVPSTRHHGSWRNALLAAGLNPDEFRVYRGRPVSRRNGQLAQCDSPAESNP